MTVIELAQKTSAQQACQVLVHPRSSYYRHRKPRPASPERPSSPSLRALPPPERDTVRETLNSSRFVDSSPRQVYGALLDEGLYLCSVSTMYRILKDNDEVRERCNQKRHPAYKKPELVATAPNQVWSWDITKLRGPVTYVYYCMYTILDIFSRYVVGTHDSTDYNSRTFFSYHCLRQWFPIKSISARLQLRKRPASLRVFLFSFKRFPGQKESS